MTDPIAVHDWSSLLDQFELAIAGGDVEQVASISVGVALGPIPPSLEGRAAGVLAGIARLEDEIATQLDVISNELNRLPVRSRRNAPPRPSQLDCTA